jgi:hypothetical protein
MLSRRFDNFGNLSNQTELQISKKPHDSVRHQFKKFFKVLHWPLKAKQIGIFLNPF